MARIEDHMTKGVDGRPMMKRGKIPMPKEALGKGRTSGGRKSASDVQSIREAGAAKLMAKTKGGAPKPF